MAILVYTLLYPSCSNVRLKINSQNSLTNPHTRTNRVTDDLITSNTGNTEPTLMNWVVCQTAVGGIVLLAVEIVLMARGL